MCLNYNEIDLQYHCIEGLSLVGISTFKDTRCRPFVKGNIQKKIGFHVKHFNAPFNHFKKH